MWKTKLDGDFTYLTVMGKEPNILVVLTGHFPLKWPPHAGIGPVILPNVELRMVLSNNWQSGTATYEYRTEALPSKETPWHEVSNVPVKMITCFVQAAAS